LDETPLFSQRFIKVKNRVKPTIGYKNDPAIWQTGRMKVISDFKFASLDRGRDGGLTQSRKGIFTGPVSVANQRPSGRPSLTLSDFAPLWLRAFALKFMPLFNCVPSRLLL
jgi:hypothetical protein